jgi:hypothetical protein
MIVAEPFAIYFVNAALGAQHSLALHGDYLWFNA